MDLISLQRSTSTFFSIASMEVLGWRTKHFLFRHNPVSYCVCLITFLQAPHQVSACRKMGWSRICFGGWFHNVVGTDTSTTSRVLNSSLASSFRAVYRQLTSASASNTFMWPGILPATGWMAYFTSTPFHSVFFKFMTGMLACATNHGSVTGQPLPC